MSEDIQNIHKFSRESGADGHAADMGEAGDLAKGLISKGH